MNSDNPQFNLSIVLCVSLIFYVIVTIILIPVLVPLLSQGEEAASAFGQVVLFAIILLLIFLLPTSYVYWSHRIHVKILGPDQAVVEIGDQLSLMVAIEFPQNILPKGAVLEAFIDSLNLTTEKVESSPTQLTFTIPSLRPGYHKIAVQVIKPGYFTGSNNYEILIAPAEPI